MADGANDAVERGGDPCRLRGRCRVRAGCRVGLAVVVCALAMFRGVAVAVGQDAGPAPPASRGDGLDTLRVLVLVLFLLLLVLVLVLGSVLLMRWGRRLGAEDRRGGQHEPTAYSDAWSEHVLPGCEADSEDDDGRADSDDDGRADSDGAI